MLVHIDVFGVADNQWTPTVLSALAPQRCSTSSSLVTERTFVAAGNSRCANADEVVGLAGDCGFNEAPVLSLLDPMRLRSTWLDPNG